LQFELAGGGAEGAPVCSVLPEWPPKAVSSSVSTAHRGMHNPSSAPTPSVSGNARN